MRLLDVNILVQAHRLESERHQEIKEWLESSLDEPEGVAVSDLVLSGTLRVITHPKVFKQPTPLPIALDFIGSFRSLANVRIVAPGDRHWQLFVGLCRRVEARGNLIPDAYHAALAMETGCDWVTLDRGFARFPGLKLLHPLD
ncbi:MAG: type II toxin-antitoxin system VapC family toxin [bacterium]